MTKEQKIEIYNSKVSGVTLFDLSLKYGINQSNIKYLVRLIEYYGVDILRENKNRHYSPSSKKQIIDEELVLNNSIKSTAIKYGLSGFMGFLKGKSSQMIYQRWANARFKYRNRSFWYRGYYVDTVGKNTKKIKEYIANQLKEDHMAEQLVMDLDDPFKQK